MSDAPYNRFLLFAGDHYYPCGGWHDFRGSFDTIGELNSYAKGINDKFDWMHAIDLETRERIEVGVRQRKWWGD